MWVRIETGLAAGIPLAALQFAKPDTPIVSNKLSVVLEKLDKNLNQVRKKGFCSIKYFYVKERFVSFSRWDKLNFTFLFFFSCKALCEIKKIVILNVSLINFFFFLCFLEPFPVYSLFQILLGCLKPLPQLMKKKFKLAWEDELWTEISEELWDKCLTIVRFCSVNSRHQFYSSKLCIAGNQIAHKVSLYFTCVWQVSNYRTPQLMHFGFVLLLSFFSLQADTELAIFDVSEHSLTLPKHLCATSSYSRHDCCQAANTKKKKKKKRKSPFTTSFSNLVNGYDLRYPLGKPQIYLVQFQQKIICYLGTLSWIFRPQTSSIQIQHPSWKLTGTLPYRTFWCLHNV